MIKRQCFICNTFFYIKPSQIKWSGGKYCSRSCYYKSRVGKIKVKQIVKQCPICKKDFSFYPSVYKWGNRENCSYKCYWISKKGKPTWNKGKKLAQFSGENHPRWKGGKKNHQDGYIYTYTPKHPFRTIQNYVFSHRLVMEKHIGRYLKPAEVVHHINGNPSDNRIKNLKLFENQSLHFKYHILTNSRPLLK